MKFYERLTRSRLSRRRLAWLLVFGVAGMVAPVPAAAQAVDPPAAPDTAVLPIPELPRSPRGAFVRSLVLPGWGQAWVGAPARGGVYFAMEAGALWMTLKSRQQLREARRLETWARDTGQLLPAELFGLTRAREDQFEDWLTLSIFLLFFSGADAWVSAHLADFDDTFGVVAAADGGVQVRARIPVGGRR
jgi:hypothetical protein